ncbi:MAG: PPC domain-containing protein, partial [Isosphaeraceae bacterium]
LGQPRPYIGFVYPAGGQQGTTVQIRLGGQQLDDVSGVLVTGPGVKTRVVAYHRRLNPQEVQLLREQLRELRGLASARSSAAASASSKEKPAVLLSEDERLALIASIENRMAEYVPTPASASISSIVLAEVTLDPKAPPGPREIRLVSPRGVTNPLPFHVGQVAEVSRKPMLSARIQVLGKEELALRKRPDDEVEQRITLPCTVNGQIASGEVNRYRFTARRGQRLVLYTTARQLIPYIADAVPGWFQPVLTVFDAAGKEVAYDDDDRFKPDPLIRFVVPRDGEYTFTIADALYRGREDFVYRVTVGELPFVTSLFPMGSRVGATPTIRMKGWNLDAAKLDAPAQDAGPATYFLEARRRGMVSNRVPFERDTLPEAFEKEPNNDSATAQHVQRPLIINGRIDRKDDVDVFSFSGQAGETVVAEVMARRLDSSLDSLIKLTGPDGKVLAYNDDHEDPGSGLNTHHADSYLMVTLPKAGKYHLSVSDVAQGGGENYAYRLRISPPRPDFALRLVPSSITLRSKAVAALTVHVLRKDGWSGPIKLVLKNPPEGFTAPAITVPKDQNVARFPVRTTLTATKEPVQIHVQGIAQVKGRQIVRQAVPAEDRMQAFLWRHLVPASDLWVTVFDPQFQPPSKRVCRVAIPAPQATELSGGQAKGVAKPKFTKRQVASRLRQLKILFEEGLLTDDLYARKVAECEAAL